MADAAVQTPAKHIILVHDGIRDAVETRASTVEALLAERGIIRRPEDTVSSAPDSALTDSSTLVYRQAVPVSLVVDGVATTVLTSAATVGEMLASRRLTVGSHDRLTPAPGVPIASGEIVKLTRVTSWIEHIRTSIAPPVARKYDLSLAAGKRRVVDAGAPGTRETTIAVLQPNPARAPKHLFLAARLLRLPRTKIIAEGIGDAATLAQIAQRGFVGTVRLADAALKMVATAYTSACSGCSGMTATGRPAGRGVVAVDPRVIPLGSQLFIPGYGRALAGDTGSEIRGNRIDLGFASHRAAMTFGRRAIVVYVLR
jgi:3D (Asp-Asp-Asp) domain-containing protein